MGELYTCKDVAERYGVQIITVCRAVKISSVPILSLRCRIRSMCPVPRSIFFTP